MRAILLLAVALSWPQLVTAELQPPRARFVMHKSGGSFLFINFCLGIAYTTILAHSISQHLCCLLGSSCWAFKEERIHNLAPESERPITNCNYLTSQRRKFQYDND